MVESAKNCSMGPLMGPVVRKVKKRTGLQAGAGRRAGGEGVGGLHGREQVREAGAAGR